MVVCVKCALPEDRNASGECRGCRKAYNQAYFRKPEVMEKSKLRSRKWRADHPDLVQQRSRSYMLKYNYGITIQEYDKILAEQNGVCAICGSSETGWKYPWFHVDHCHKTGKVRGLLCQRCNPGIGIFYENPEILRRAAVYIESHGQ